MKSQISRRITVSVVIAIVVFGIARRESPAGAPDSQDLRQMVIRLQHEVAALDATVLRQEADLRKLHSTIDAQDLTIAQLGNSVSSHEQKLQFVTVDGTDMYITGANLNIRDGSGATGGTLGSPYIPNPNGLGNLIIGYNENGIPPCTGCPSQAERPRTGSHNLVLGVDNGYTSIGGIVAGFSNTISGPYATITAGEYSIASDKFSSVSGGEGNSATAEGAAVCGGHYGVASGLWSSVSGGEDNSASAEGAAVSGGLQGVASGRWSSVSAGSNNTASAESSSVSGGSANTASVQFSSVSGGTGNTVSAQSSSISGGGFVVVNQQFSWAAGNLVWP